MIKMIKMFKVAMSKNVDKSLLDLIHSGALTQGPKVEEFEKELSKKFNNNNILTLSSGTHGLSLALRLANVGRDDEVITTPLSCTATTMPILGRSSNVVWADISKDLNINPQSIKENITDKTKAILVMHWGGYPCSMEEIKEIAGDIPIIEDAAHCYGSTYKNSIIGDCAYSDFCMISTQAIKSLTTVDGGLLFTKRREDYEKGKLVRWFFINRETGRINMRCYDDIKEYGEKWHMNDVNATIGLSNMKLAEENVKINIENANYYNQELSKISGIELIQTATDRQSSCWLYSILVEDRDSFSDMMGSKGIEVSQVHDRIDKHSFVEKFRKKLPTLDEIYSKYCCIPVGWWVDKESREYIVESIHSGW